MAILCHRWWPLQESVFFALEGEPVLDAGHALYCSTYYSRAVSVARSHISCRKTFLSRFQLWNNIFVQISFVFKKKICKISPDFNVFLPDFQLISSSVPYL
jgi:hypothetical protein